MQPDIFKKETVLLRDLDVSDDVMGQGSMFAVQLGLCVKILKHSPTAQVLLKRAVDSCLSLSMDPLLQSDCSLYYPQLQRVDLGYQAPLMIGTEKGIAQHLAALIGAIDKVGAHYEDVVPGAHAPDLLKILRQMRHERAYGLSLIAKIAWELRAGGIHYLWRDLIGGQNADIAHNYASAREGKVSRIDADIALQESMAQWFCDDARVDACDQDMIERIDAAFLYRHSLTMRRFCIQRRRMRRKNYLNDANLSRLRDIIRDFAATERV